jgi:hypothetical protein
MFGNEAMFCWKRIGYIGDLYDIDIFLSLRKRFATDNSLSNCSELLGNLGVFEHGEVPK